MTASSADAVAVEQLEKRFGATVALAGLSFSVAPAELFGIVFLRTYAALLRLKNNASRRSDLRIGVYALDVDAGYTSAARPLPLSRVTSTLRCSSAESGARLGVCVALPAFR